jgi:hypothetical protein
MPAYFDSGIVSVEVNEYKGYSAEEKQDEGNEKARHFICTVALQIRTSHD